MDEVLVRCLAEKRDSVNILKGYHFYKNQIYEASHCRNLWFIHDHKHNTLTIEESKFPKCFKPISDNLFSYNLWSTHHFYAQTKRITNNIGIKCECNPKKVQPIVLGKSNPVKIYHSWVVHLMWKCAYCHKEIPFEVDLNSKTIQPFQELRIERMP